MRVSEKIIKKSDGIQLGLFITKKKSFDIKKYTNFDGLIFKMDFIRLVSIKYLSNNLTQALKILLHYFLSFYISYRLHFLSVSFSFFNT